VLMVTPHLISLALAAIRNSQQQSKFWKLVSMSMAKTPLVVLPAGEL
jgi:hypothetical protein